MRPNWTTPKADRKPINETLQHSVQRVGSNNPYQRNRNSASQISSPKGPVKNEQDIQNDQKDFSKLNPIIKIAQRQSHYRLISGFNGLRLNMYRTSIAGYKTVKLLDIGKKIIFRWKNHGWIRLIKNRDYLRKKQQTCKKLAYLVNGLNCRIKRLVLLKMRSNAIIMASQMVSLQSTEQTPQKLIKRSKVQSMSSVNSTRSPTEPQGEETQLEKMVLSRQVITTLSKLKIFRDKQEFFELSTNELKQSCELQKQRLNKIKLSDRMMKGKQFDNQILIAVLINHITTLINFSQDIKILQNQMETKSARNSNLAVLKHNSSHLIKSEQHIGISTAIVARRYEHAVKQIEASDQQLSQLLQQNKTDYDKLAKLLRDQIHNFKKDKSDKLILSRIHLSEIIINLIANLSSNLGTNHHQIDPQSHHHYVELVNQLVSKVKELSTICEQIPQLETFKRNLDLTQVTHEEHFVRIVDVLITLHHKVNSLLRMRPADMVAIIQAYRNQCKNVENLTHLFICRIEQGHQDIQPIVFETKRGDHIEEFYPVHRNISALSKLFIKEMQSMHQSDYLQERLKVIVEIFWNLATGLKSFENQWRTAIANNEANQTEKQILLMLNQCLQTFNERTLANEKRAREAQQMLEMKQRETSVYHDQLQREISALLSDFNAVNQKNEELEKLLTTLMNEKQEYLQESRKINFQVTKSCESQPPKHKQIQKISVLERENFQMRDSIQNLRNQLKRNTQTNQQNEKDVRAENDRKMKNLKNRIQELEKENKNFNVKLNTLKADLMSSSSKLHEKQLQIQKITRTLQSTKNQYKDYCNRNKPSEKESVYSKSLIQSLKQELQAAQKNNKRILQKLQESSRNYAESSINETKSREKIESLKSTIISLEQQLGTTEGKLNILELEQGKLKHQNARLKEQNNQLRRVLVQQQQDFQQTLQKEINVILTEKNSVQQRLKNSRLQTEELRRQLPLIKQYEQKIFQTENLLRNKQQQYRTLKVQKESYITKIKTINNNFQQKNEKRENMISRLEQEIEELQSKLNKEASQKEALKSKLEKSEGYITRLEQQTRSFGDSPNIYTQRHQYQPQPPQNYQQQSSQYHQSMANYAQQPQIVYNVHHHQQQRQFPQTNLSSQVSFTPHKSTYMSHQSLDIHRISIPTPELKVSQAKRIRTTNDQVISKSYRDMRVKPDPSNFRNSGYNNDLLVQIQMLKDREHILILEITEKSHMVEELRNEIDNQSHEFKRKQQMLLSQIRGPHRNYQNNRDTLLTSHKETQYKLQIEQLRQLLQSGPEVKRFFGSNRIQRVDDQRKIISSTLQELIQGGDRDDTIIVEKINQIISLSNVICELEKVSPPQARRDIEKLMQNNKKLIDLAVTMGKEREKLLSVLRNYPDPQHLTEFLFRILMHFALLTQDSRQSVELLETLQRIQSTTVGPQYFLQLEDFAKKFYETEVKYHRKKVLQDEVPFDQSQCNVRQSVPKSELI